MAGYGYRLWAVELHHGRKHTRQPWGQAALPITDAEGKPAGATRTVDYFKAATADVNAAAGRTHNFGMSRGADDEGAGAGTGASMRFKEAINNGGSLRLRFEHGIRHSDGTLIDPDDETAVDVPLRNKSTLHPYRATLVAKPDQLRGLLAVEARGRSCPMVSAVRGMNNVSIDGWRVRAISHLAGEAAMMDFIRNAAIDRVAFDRWGYAKDGTRERREVSMGVHTGIEGEKVIAHLERWARDYFGFQKQHKVDQEVERANRIDFSQLPEEERAAAREAAKAAAKTAVEARKVEKRLSDREIARAAAESMKETVFATRSEDVNIDFTDVSVEVSNHGADRTFRPLSDFGNFTYGISDAYPGDERFFSAAESTAANLIDTVQTLQL